MLRETLTVHCSQHLKGNVPYFRRSPKVVTIIPQAEMGSESIAHVAEWAIDSEAIRARGIIIVLVKSNYSCSWSKISRQNNFS